MAVPTPSRTTPFSIPAEALVATPGAPDADFAAALGLPDCGPTSAVAEGPDEPRVTEAILAHFAVARPGPSSFPSIATQILELVRYPDLDLAELSRYIKLDGALAGGVLALANSAVYRGVRTVETVKDAVARLGISEVARLAAAIAMRSLYNADASAEFARFTAVWDRLFLHAATSARAASELAKRRADGKPGPEQTFMAGLLHDIGTAIALRSLAALAIAGRVPLLDDAAVGRVLQRVHVAIGIEMHKVWNLPAALAEVARHHHDETIAPGVDRAMLHLVRLASAMDLLRRSPGVHPRGPVEVVQSARALGLSPASVREVFDLLDASEGWVRTAFPAR